MKLFSSLLLLLVVITVGCSRKTTAASKTTTTTPTTTTTTTTNEPVKPLLDSAEAAEGTTTAPAAPAAVAKPMIIVDARGNFAVKEEDLPPDASKSILNNSNARAYTPAELKTLSYRYGQIPPRILYVPTALQKKNSRGTYYVFMKKYWYWQKSNGYFYLDEHYYK
ncbi:hypothetical protein FC093_08810 [Ilyomonas limi]|jgi:hypothetical protein|uniref:Uncharacterized protein n=1 Tax=Ilyomonas limi TaxID=2575867 RepID=A0A4U3L4Z8_9BACT|nr:hypothetical protein [Ilyomonas limi]TKK69404.1 hypothetical protein FC093_08810 [Ilyomonas limi]